MQLNVLCAIIKLAQVPLVFFTGLLDDALREYYELEAVYLEAVQAGQLARQGFGGKAPDLDEAALLWHPWHGIRQVCARGDGRCVCVW